MLLKTAQQVVRVFKILAGFTLLLAGVIMLVTPGPGLVTIAGGLVLLAAEFAWARHLLNKMKAKGVEIRDAVFSNGKRAPAASAAPSESPK